MITHRINLLFLLFLLLAGITYPDQITSRLEKYVQEELEKKDSTFRKKLDECLSIYKKYYWKDKRLEKEIEEKGCKPYIKEYENIIEKATERYQEDVDKELKKLEKKYQEKVKKSKKVNFSVKAYGYSVGGVNFIFFNVEADPQKFGILELKHKGENKISPSCLTDRSIWIYFPADKKEYSIDLILADKKELENIKGIKGLASLKNVYTLRINLKVKGFSPIKLFKTKTGKKYRLSLNTPVVPYGYASYDFVGVKKEFPPFPASENPCRKPVLMVEHLPDSVYIRLTVEENKHVMDREFRVY
ncbi:hypothetical protein SAMN06265182_0950 [Persephonella hydrogeniphila]|uniref:Uncharacterized protein n=1 Tax=Persephonella hydrogeniphila TaxID=198703 RepID=A0A285NCY3_9AQUI|nr:hypothetical protein [Persephonella hydrogeniphila]SNZ07158.1 hypothetical protein SAMN06265182_0950 [Persephonella hydrogeniphila]